MSGRVVVLQGDAAHLPLPDGSVDSVVCDPPYGLAELPAALVVRALTAWIGGDREHVPSGPGGFMGREWDRFVPPPAAWDECLRVLKPGGFLLAFAGSRTAGLMEMSIRLAGFEIRDGIDWIYGQGYAKSLNVSKAIDKRRNDRADTLRVTSWLADAADAGGISRAQVDTHMCTSDMGGWWLSRLEHRCAVPTWEQWEQLRELIGFGGEMDAEVWRLNGRKGEPGEAWQAAEVLRTEERFNEPSGIVQVGQGDRLAVTRQIKAANTDGAARWSGWGTALKPAREPIIMARKPLSEGTVAANVLAHGTGAINVQACQVGTEPRVNSAGGASSLQRVSRVEQGYRPNVTTSRSEASEVAGRWPPNVLLSEDAAAELDAQGGASVSRVGQPRASTKPGDGWGMTHTGAEYADEGGPSRFFPVFRYEAKADAASRPRLPDGTAWPTVKPVPLLRWLARLVTRPGGTILDPFAGTGTTGEAAILEGFDAILMDKDPQAIALTRVRLAKPMQPAMFAPEPAAEPARPAAKTPPPQESLFDLDGAA